MLSSHMVRTGAVLIVAALVAAVLLVRPPQVEAQQNELSQFDVAMGVLATVFVAEEDLEMVLQDNPLLELGYEGLTGSDAYNPFRGNDVTYNDDVVRQTTIGESFAVTVVREDLYAEIADAFFGEEVEGVQDDINDRNYTEWEADLSAAIDDTIWAPSQEPVFDAESVMDELGIPPLEPLLVVGARTVEPRADQTCSGLRREWGVFFDTEGLTNWDDTTGADPTAFNDFFYNGDTGILGRCIDGDRTQFQTQFAGPGNGFTETESPIVSVSGPFGWMMFIPMSQFSDANGFRYLEFVTDLMAPYNPDYTAASAYPSDLTQLHPLSDVPVVVYDATKDRPASQAPATTSSTTSSSTTSTTSGATTSSTAAPGSALPGGIDDPAVASPIAGESNPFGWINGPVLMLIGAVLMVMGFVAGRMYFNVGVEVAVEEELDRNAE